VQGAGALFKGVTKGITGVFEKPFEGARDEGAKGFFTGLAKGVTGLVTKPVAGVVSAVAKTAEGVKNTVQSSAEQPNDVRERAPIIFKDKVFDSLGCSVARIELAQDSRDCLISEN
jgi:vacuolar protein sorting-associated protein 13A/C